LVDRNRARVEEMRTAVELGVMPEPDADE